MPVSLVRFRAISIATLTIAYLNAATVAPADQVIVDYRDIVANRAPLEATPFARLPLGSIHADGWLLRQLQLQKAGLTGSAEQLYDALAPDSGWLGGTGNDGEKTPYYVKGLVALAYTLDDPELKQRAQKWIDWTVQSQQADGSFGPRSNHDWWPRMLVLFYLRDYYEATGDARVIPFLMNYFRYQLSALPNRPLRDWGRARAGDNIDVVLWTYNRTGDASLLELARLLRDQSYPWTSIFTDNRFYGFGADFQPCHNVNVNQALKMPAICWQFTHDDADRQAFEAGIANLQRQFGRIDGQFSGTEMLSGRRGIDGVEFCCDIERIISNGIAITILGEAALGDQLEKVAYNSLPAHTSPAMRQMTYYQLPNQIACVLGGHGFAQDYPNANMPGPHSGFPCCCYNWHSGWPKFVQHMWAATSDGGLALIAYGPNHVTATVDDGVPVTITQNTDYPFDGKITLNIQPQRTAIFPLVLRIPGWCEHPRIAVNGQPQADAQPGTFARIQRQWKADDKVDLEFPMEVRASTWTDNSVGLERGPLAFVLKIKEHWQSVHKYPGDFDEFEIEPRSAWNYALQIDRNHPVVAIQTQAISAVPFAPESAPVVLTMPAKRLPSWGLRKMLDRGFFGYADGAWRQLIQASATLEPGVPHHVRIEANGKKIRIFVDDMVHPLIEREDATFSSGGIGLRTYDAAARFDSVKLNGNPITGALSTFGGSWTDRDGQYVAERAKDGKAMFKDQADARDFTYEANISVEAGGDAGLIFRVHDPTPYLDGYHGYYFGLSARKSESHDADEPPPSPVVSDQPIEKVELIPFGSTKLRISYFPVLKDVTR